ncbi:cilia- and flagella-associated protein 206 [Coccinella septempunctata]|uniref:cilia- and flagella-associated protein 206 n=1 Tax=Coccinella septempunctata TaxID=41139 RepID=UPI001D084609|nr:cilia- and flagella-associated protein 206 [Coccinella septempunctata]
MSLENILKKVVQEISRELVHRNIHIKEIFIRYYAGLLALDPSWGISKSVLHNRHKIQKFVKYVTMKLANQFDPDIITMKMQLYYNLNCEDRDEMIKKLRSQLTAKLVPLQKDILRVKSVGTADTKLMRKFYKKLIYYMALHSGMGNPSHDNVFKEIQTALRSVMTDQEIRDYINRSASDKKERLNEFSELVAGIRLFNRFCGKSGEGIEDVPKMLRKALAAMQQELQKLLLTIMQKVNVLTTILDIHYVPVKIKSNSYEMHFVDMPEGVSMNDVERIKNLLIMYRQYEIFIRQLMSKMTKIEDREEEISEKLKKMYERINDSVQYMIAVPAYQIFPMFRELARVWFRMQDEALLLGKYNDMLVSLAIYAKQIVYPDYERQDWVIEQLLGGYQPETDAERMRAHSGTAIVPSEDPDFKVVRPNQYENFKKIDFEFLGFCPWKMVETDGALIAGNPKIGFVEGHGKHYIFSQPMAMNMFNADSKLCINRALELFRKKPEMINFLGVQEDLIAVKDIEELIPPEEVELETFSVECQTLDHPIPSNIDLNYKWNIWDLKREALLLAQLSHCKTSSTQTEECAGLCPATVQTYDLKEQGVQTKRDHGTNVPKPLQYLFGLRGRSDDKQMQLELTETIEHS